MNVMKIIEIQQLELYLTAEWPLNAEWDKDENEDQIGTAAHVKGILARGLRMPCFDERHDDMDTFLHRFESYADSHGWKKGQWAVYLSAVLK